MSPFASDSTTFASDFLNSEYIFEYSEKALNLCRTDVWMSAFRVLSNSSANLRTIHFRFFRLFSDLIRTWIWFLKISIKLIVCQKTIQQSILSHSQASSTSSEVCWQVCEQKAAQNSSPSAHRRSLIAARLSPTTPNSDAYSGSRLS